MIRLTEVLAGRDLELIHPSSSTIISLEQISRGSVQLSVENSLRTEIPAVFLTVNLSSPGETQEAILPPKPACRAPGCTHCIHCPAPTENFQFDKVTVSEGADKFPLRNEKQGEGGRKRKSLTPS